MRANFDISYSFFSLLNPLPHPVLNDWFYWNDYEEPRVLVYTIVKVLNRTIQLFIQKTVQSGINTINDKRKYNCALDIHLYGHVYYNVLDHPEFSILHSNMPVCSILALENTLIKSHKFNTITYFSYLQYPLNDEPIFLWLLLES